MASTLDAKGSRAASSWRPAFVRDTYQRRLSSSPRSRTMRPWRSRADSTVVREAFSTRMREARSTWLQPSSRHNARSTVHCAGETLWGVKCWASTRANARWVCRTRYPRPLCSSAEGVLLSMARMVSVVTGSLFAAVAFKGFCVGIKGTQKAYGKVPGVLQATLHCTVAVQASTSPHRARPHRTNSHYPREFRTFSYAGCSHH